LKPKIPHFIAEFLDKIRVAQVGRSWNTKVLLFTYQSLRSWANREPHCSRATGVAPVWERGRND